MHMDYEKAHCKNFILQMREILTAGNCKAGML